MFASRPAGSGAAGLAWPGASLSSELRCSELGEPQAWGKPAGGRGYPDLRGLNSGSKFAASLMCV